MSRERTIFPTRMGALALSTSRKWTWTVAPWGMAALSESVLPPSPESLALSASTVRALRQSSPTTSIVTSRPLKRVVTVADLATKRAYGVVNSAVLQIWEGTIKSIDFKTREMDVLLNAKMGNEKPHTAQISLQWVAEQDLDLVRPGAVFYLTLYKRTEKGSVQNAQELRFRRRPAWSRQQVLWIRKEAELLGKKLVERPTT